MATEAGPSGLVSPKLGVVILGASTYPRYPRSRELDNVSFARSAAAFRCLMADESATVFGKPAILDLFDVGDDPASVIRRVQEFLKSAPALTDILFYYCGHGAVLSDHTYYLTLKATDPENEAFTGLQVRQMRLALEVQLTRKRVFLVFDCCFAGKAAREWMATGIGQVIEEEVLRSFPRQGLGLIAASARNKVAVAREREPRTMFTGALLDTISTGVAGEKRELSFRDIVDAVRARISDRYGSAGVAPEIHAPWQDEGDITFTPFFVNRAFVPPSETKAERETFELAVADLDRPLLRTRLGAVETLEELLSSTQSAAFRMEILNKLRIVQEADDSQRVRRRCEEILARWPEHSDDERVREEERRRQRKEKREQRKFVTAAWDKAWTALKSMGTTTRAPSAPWFDLKSWSYRKIAVGGAALGFIADMMRSTGLHALSLGDIYFLSVFRALYTAGILLLVAKLTTKQGIRKQIVLFLGLYVIRTILEMYVIKFEAFLGDSLDTFLGSLLEMLLVWLFVAAVFLSLKDLKMLGIAAAAGAVLGMFEMVLTNKLLPGGFEFNNLLLGVFEFASTAVCLAYGIRRQRPGDT